MTHHLPQTTSPVRPRLVTTVLLGSAFLAGIDLFIVNVAFDNIAEDLNTGSQTASLSSLSWILNAYAVLFAALLVPMGRLTDRYGRKNGFILGLLVFTLASAACGFSETVGQLIVFRGLQAVGAAAMTPASLGLLLAALPPDRRAAASRLWAVTTSLAATLGPVAGGALVQISWHWAFFVNVPIGLLFVVAAIKFVPNVHHNSGAPRPDLTGAAILTVAVGALVLAVVQGNEWGWTSPRIGTSLAVTVVGLAAFSWLTIHHPSPVIDPALLRVRSFVWANLATLVFQIGFGAALLTSILWMQQIWAYSALRTGLAIAIGPTMVPTTSILTQWFLPHIRRSRLAGVGAIVGVLGGVFLAVRLSENPAYWTTFLPGWLVIGVSVGLVMPNLISAATSSLAPDQASTGGGIITMSRQLGLVLGVSVLVSILGNGAPTSTSFTQAWLFVAGASLVASGCAFAMQASKAGLSDGQSGRPLEPSTQ